MSFAAVLFATVTVNAAPAVIECRIDSLKLLNGAAVETLNEVKVLKLVSKSDKDHPQGIMTFKLDPDVEFYTLSYQVKTENIVSRKKDMYGADIILRPSKGGALRFSSNGTYRCDVGTSDWKNVSFKINAKRYLKEQPITMIMRIAYAPGTAWYKDIKLTPVVPKK